MDCRFFGSPVPELRWCGRHVLDSKLKYKLISWVCAYVCVYVKVCIALSLGFVHTGLGTAKGTSRGTATRPMLTGVWRSNGFGRRTRELTCVWSATWQEERKAKYEWRSKVGVGLEQNCVTLLDEKIKSVYMTFGISSFQSPL